MDYEDAYGHDQGGRRLVGSGVYHHMPAECLEVRPRFVPPMIHPPRQVVDVCWGDYSAQVQLSCGCNASTNYPPDIGATVVCWICPMEAQA